MSSLGLSRLDRFSLYQRPWPIFPGRHCTAVNCNPNCNPALSVKAPGWKTPGLLRAVTGGVVPLPLCGPRCVTRCRGLPCLLAGQTALTPSAKPPGKPGLHHAHLPLFQRKSHGEPGWPRRCSACGSPACDTRRCQRAARSGVSTIRPRSEAGTTVNATSWDDSRVMRPVLTAAARACPWGIVMFESPTLNLVQELSSVKEFTVTEDQAPAACLCGFGFWRGLWRSGN